MSTSYVHLKVENKVGYIEFYNPPHNALPSEMLARLTELIELLVQIHPLQLLFLKVVVIAPFVQVQVLKN